MSRTSPTLAGLVLLATLAACSSDSAGGGLTSLTVAKTPTNSGDAQNGMAGAALASPLRVVVTDGGTLASGVTVTWATTGGGTLLPSGTTDASGIASANWTLGAGGGAQTATASVAGASGSPLTFSATSPTVPTITVGPGGAAQFSPASITINAGQTVRFVWASGATNHNVSPDTGNPSALPASPGLPGVKDAPFEYDATFPTAGTIKFFCTVHGGNPSNGTVTGMSGTVTVN